MKKKASDSIFHNEIPMERFRRVCGLFDSIPPSEWSSIEAAAEFGRLRKQIEGMIDTTTRKFTQDDAPDFVHNLNLLFTRVASIPILRAFMNGNREDLREAVGEDGYMRYLSSDGYRGATDPLLPTADRDAYVRGDALYVLHETRRQQLSQNHTETVRASLVETLWEGWLWVCLPLLVIALVCLGLKILGDEHWRKSGLKSEPSVQKYPSSVTGERPTFVKADPEANAAPVTPPTGAVSPATEPLREEPTGTKNPRAVAGPMIAVQEADPMKATPKPGTVPVTPPTAAAPPAAEALKKEEASEGSHKSGGTNNSNQKIGDWWDEIGKVLVGEFPKESKAKPLMKAIYAITILALAGMAGATGAFLSTLMRILGVAGSSQLGRNIVQFQSSRMALKLGPLLGAIFATVLSGLFAARVVTLDIFPQLDNEGKIPWFFVYYYHTDFAKWMIWAFIAGFSERLVPDMLDRLTARAQGEAKAQSVVTSTTETLKIGSAKSPPTTIPQNIRLVQQTDGLWKATWDAVQGADKYILSKKHEGTDQDFVALPEVTTGTEAVIGNLPRTGALKFQVKANNSAGDGPVGTAEIVLPEKSFNEPPLGQAAQPYFTTAQKIKYAITEPALHFGAWDGSAGVACGPEHFVGATDEDNTLRLYPAAGGAEGMKLLDLNDWGPFPKKQKHDGVTFREADIEGAARIGDVIYWISSHARDSDRKVCPERRVFFATKLTGSGTDTMLETTGTPYTQIVEDILADGRLGDLQTAVLAEKAPKEEGGFNIESLCADSDLLYVGFRNPLVDGKALLLPLMNPSPMIHEGKRALFGDPIPLNLGGLGFRDMVKWRGEFLILAGDYRDRFDDQSAQGPKLFRWSGKRDESPIEMMVNLRDLNPEAALVFGNEMDGPLLILSDDGKWNVQPGENRKMTPVPERRFRSVWLKAE